MQAIKTIWNLYKEDGDKLSLLMEFARVVTKFGNTEYVGEAMGVLEEIEMRGWIERNREVYFLMAQIEILRGNIMIGYKLFMEALKHLNKHQDWKRIEYISSFILPYKTNIEKAIKLEQLIEQNSVLSLKEFNEAIEELEYIRIVDGRYSDLMKLKLYSWVLPDSIDLLLMIDRVYNHRYNDIKLCIYYFDMAFTHKDLVTMVYLRDQLLILIQNNETISTCEYVKALDLIYHTYDFQGKFRNAIEILDRINSLVPPLPEDYDLERIRKLIHCHKDQTSEDTEDYNIRIGPVPLLDFTQIEKINISKLIMKEGISGRVNHSMLSDKSPERKIKTGRANLLENQEEKLLDITDDDILEDENKDKELVLGLDIEENSSFKASIIESTESEEDYNIEENSITFMSFSDPKYYFEKGKLCWRIVLDYHAKINSLQEEEDQNFPDLITFEDTRDDRAMQSLTSRDYNELLEEGLEALVEFLLNLFYRKQYYTEDGFNSKKEKAFFWIWITLFKLKRYEESIDLIKRYSHKWKHSEDFINSIVFEMVKAHPQLQEKLNS